MYCLYIKHIPKDGTMSNAIIFGILIVAIAAVSAGTFTTVLDDIVQDASAVRDVPPGQDNPGHFPGQGQSGGQGGQQGPKGPHGTEGGSGP